MGFPSKKPVDKEAAHDVLKKLICMAQEMMMKGMGHDEEAGGMLADKLKHGDLAEGSEEEEKAESPMEEKKEDDMGGPDDDFEAYKQKEMKRSHLRSPIKDRKVAIMIAARPGKSMGGRGKY